VREALRSAVASVYGEASIGGDADFVPHVSVAYNNAPIPAAPVIDVVARLRSVGTVDVVVSSLSLVEMWREQRTYVWKTIDAITLTADREV
jgi:2'-5' RNA ligase